MSLSVRTLAKARTTLLPTAQRRTIVDWMTNYPDKVRRTLRIGAAGRRWAVVCHDGRLLLCFSGCCLLILL